MFCNRVAVLYERSTVFDVMRSCLSYLAVTGFLPVVDYKKNYSC